MSILGFIIVISLLLGALAWIFFVWTVRSGQYEDPEGPKYRMLDDDEARPPTPTANTTATATTTATPTANTTATPTANTTPTDE